VRLPTGDLSQAQTDGVMKSLEGDTNLKCLLLLDVAARGIAKTLIIFSPRSKLPTDEIETYTSNHQGQIIKIGKLGKFLSLL
jgi:hypothetical protein